MGPQRKHARAIASTPNAKGRKYRSSRGGSRFCHLLPKHKNLGMETTKELRSRFRSAFKRFSAEDTAMRKMKADLSGDNVTLGIHGINAQSRLISHAEHDYKAVRLEYSDRLLSDPPEGGTG
jgi:hypothetical protein